MALEILVRNSGRDTRGQRVETEEKSALSTACVSFLRASSFDWHEALECSLHFVHCASSALCTAQRTLYYYGTVSTGTRRSGCSVMHRAGALIFAFILGLQLAIFSSKLAPR